MVRNIIAQSRVDFKSSNAQRANRPTPYVPPDAPTLDALMAEIAGNPENFVAAAWDSLPRPALSDYERNLDRQVVLIRAAIHSDIADILEAAE